MKSAVTSEIKYSIYNTKFICGVLLLFLAAVIAGNPYVNQLLDIGSAEGSGWYASFRYSMSADKFLLLVPIAAPFAAAANAETEFGSRFSIFCRSRIGKKNYLAGKVLGTAVSGGLMVMIASAAAAVFSFARLHRIPGSMEMSGGKLALDLLLCLLIGFLNGALWAMTGSCAAVMAKNRYLAFAAPFVLYYVLSEFQNRYYRTLFVLSPKYWAAPIYYSPFICIMLLLLMCTVVGAVFVLVMRRRLAHG